MAHRNFTLEDAQSHVPFLEETFQSLKPLRRKEDRLNRGIADLAVRARSNGGGEVERKLNTIQHTLKETSEHIESQLRELERRGIIVRSGARGLVDFPSVREGREVYLCWTEGETEIRFWHEMDTGFAGRQPI